ncbi:MAG: hypothetical protein A2341_14365 [Deltaproteobacteria bacterium RIFOXYB12_FULL_58_9]|nr:MAG: hypothetical protein A2341_14365 [Deltaproteobacteria bacterium RIFOXYB12_FULL_58_9]
MSAKNRTVRVFRYHPETGGDGAFHEYSLALDDESKTTVLDLLLRIQREHDPSLAFRYACRVSMCGSCAMVVNGQEALACKTVVAALPSGPISIRPLNHFPVIKDLVVDMDPFFDKYFKSAPYFDGPTDQTEPAQIRPDSRERKLIGLSTECIACGCCVSSCTMVAQHPTYLGPASLNRAFSLLLDSRDQLRTERMAAVLESCYACRTEFNCTQVCPKELSPTRAIKHIQRMALGTSVTANPRGNEAIAETKPDVGQATVAADMPTDLHGTDLCRRAMLKRALFAVGGVSALATGSVLGMSVVGPSLDPVEKKRVRLGVTEDFAPGEVRTMMVKYSRMDAFHEAEIEMPVMVTRSDENELVAFNSRCTHLGCEVHWDTMRKLFLCACHGGAFNVDGSVKAGPPPRPLARYPVDVVDGHVYVEVS